MITKPLSREQRKAAEEIAQEQAVPCYSCRSTVWRSPYSTEPGTGAFTLVLTCASCGKVSRKLTRCPGRRRSAASTFATTAATGWVERKALDDLVDELLGRDPARARPRHKVGVYRS